MNRSKKILSFLILFLIFTFSAKAAFSQAKYQNQEKIPGYDQTTEFPDYMEQVVGFFFAVVGILALFMLIIGAYQYLMAAGNIGKVDSAKNTISSALLGLILGLTAFIILRTINPDFVNSSLQSLSSVNSGTGTSTSSSSSSTEKPGANAGKCVSGSGNCDESKLSCFGSRAKDASIVCNAESGGAAAVGSGTDKCGSFSASWGLMQINIAANQIDGLNCPSAFTCPYDGKGCNRSTCKVKNTELAEKCRAAASDPAKNIAKACAMYNSSGFKPWGAARKCKVNLSK